MDITPLYPVILSVSHPASDRLAGSDRLSGREKNALLQRTARQALSFSAQRSGVTLGTLSKDGRGAPLPIDGVYWSLSHKTYCVAAVVSGERIGIDVEELRPRSSEDLFAYLAAPDEWRLCSDPGWDLFYRYWTAKEAATKATGVGIRDLRVCKVIAIPDERHLVLDYEHRLWNIEHYWYKNHIISLVADNKPIEWVVGDERWVVGDEGR